MARFAQSFDFHRPSPSSADTKQRFSEEDESSVLDENILDSYTPDMSPLTGNRRDSFTDSNANFSPREDGWSDYTRHDVHAPVRVSASTNPFFEQSNNPFVRPQASQASAYAQHSSTWAMDGTSGSCTPTAVYDHFQSEYEPQCAGSYSAGAVGSIDATTYGGLPYRTGTVFGGDGSLSTSPTTSSKDWMSMNSSDPLEPRSIPKRMRPGSPSYRSHSPLLRRDGIRKKNARFEIPAERNLQNIDQLIGLTSDEQEIKELKQQKRLLRNRQAAYDILVLWSGIPLWSRCPC